VTPDPVAYYFTNIPPMIPPSNPQMTTKCHLIILSSSNISLFSVIVPPFQISASKYTLAQHPAHRVPPGDHLVEEAAGVEAVERAGADPHPGRRSRTK